MFYMSEKRKLLLIVLGGVTIGALTAALNMHVLFAMGFAFIYGVVISATCRTEKS